MTCLSAPEVEVYGRTASGEAPLAGGFTVELSGPVSSTVSGVTGASGTARVALAKAFVSGSYTLTIRFTATGGSSTASGTFSVSCTSGTSASVKPSTCARTGTSNRTIDVQVQIANVTRSIVITPADCAVVRLLSPVGVGMDDLDTLDASLTWDDKEQPFQLEPSGSSARIDWKLPAPLLGRHNLVLSLHVPAGATSAVFRRFAGQTFRTAVSVTGGSAASDTEATQQLAPSGTCPSPTVVQLTSSQAVDVRTGDCIVFIASWYAETAADRQAILDAADARMALDGKLLQIAEATRRASGYYVADVLATVLGLAPGTHNVAISVDFSRTVAVAGGVTARIPKGSRFIAGAVVRATGKAQASSGPDVIPPCPAREGPNGAAFGTPRPGGPVCQPWGVDADPLPADRGDAVNAPISLCGGRSTQARSRRHADCPPGTAAATIIAIVGDDVWVKRADGTFVKAQLQMPLNVGDQVSTGKTGVAAIEFTVGGKVGLNHGTVIQVSGNRSAVDGNGDQLGVNRGSVWARFEQSKSQILIKTPSAAFGIRG